MKLICGLGNPGREYDGHRHNIGFKVVEELARRAGIGLNSGKFEARSGHGSLGRQKVLLMQPQQFMNLSGQATSAAARFYKIPVEEVLVIHDELDLPFGRLQLKAGGGAGGHNGLRSLIDCLGTDAFPRVRFGIGKPEGANAKERVVGHVLASFSKEEAPLLEELIVKAADAAECWASAGLSTAMNRFNKKA